MPNGKSPLVTYLVVLGGLAGLLFGMWGIIGGISGSYEGKLDVLKAEMCERMDARAYPATKGVVLETEIENMNKTLDKVDEKQDKMSEKMDRILEKLTN